MSSCVGVGGEGEVVEAVVERTGELTDGSADVLAELERAIGALSPGIGSSDGEEIGEDPVERLLREVVRRVSSGLDGEGGRVLEEPRRLPEEALLSLARVLSGAAVRRYRVASSSRPGAFYVLDVEEGEVTCTCPGFEYRGACSHARALKSGMVKGGVVPAGSEVVV